MQGGNNSQDNTKEVSKKTNHTECEKIFARHVINEGLVFRKYKKRLQINKRNNPKERCLKILNKHFTKDVRPMEEKKMKSFSNH